MRHTILKGLHVLALGTWFGGAAFFNFVVALSIFASFNEVVQTAPNDRTAFVPIVPAGSEDKKDDLANALAGSAVGPVFPKYFAMQAGCGVVALLTALAWWNAGGAVHRWRVYVIGVALLTVAVGWPISNYVSDVRLLRYSADPATADAAKAAFASWHLVSLGLSMATIALAGIALALAAKLPGDGEQSPPIAMGGL